MVNKTPVHLQICQVDQRCRRKKDKIALAEFNKLLAAQCDFQSKRVRRFSISGSVRFDSCACELEYTYLGLDSVAGNCVFYCRRWVNPLEPEGRARLVASYKDLSDRYPSITSGNTEENFLHVLSTVCARWRLRILNEGTGRARLNKAEQPPPPPVPAAGFDHTVFGPEGSQGAESPRSSEDGGILQGKRWGSSSLSHDLDDGQQGPRKSRRAHRPPLKGPDTVVHGEGSGGDGSRYLDLHSAGGANGGRGRDVGVPATRPGTSGGGSAPVAALGGASEFHGARFAGGAKGDGGVRRVNAGEAVDLALAAAAERGLGARAELERYGCPDSP